jgi:hypothetical protein
MSTFSISAVHKLLAIYKRAFRFLYFFFKLILANFRRAESREMHSAPTAWAVTLQPIFKKYNSALVQWHYFTFFVNSLLHTLSGYYFASLSPISVPTLSCFVLIITLEYQLRASCKLQCTLLLFISEHLNVSCFVVCTVCLDHDFVQLLPNFCYLAFFVYLFSKITLLIE